MKKTAYNFQSKGILALQCYLKIFNNKWFLLLLLVGFASGCKKIKEETGLIGVCPIVVSTSPLSNATAVSLSTVINVTFNEAINPTSLTAVTFTLRQGTTPIAGVIAYSGVTATFTPTNTLTPNTQYTGTVAMNVKDMAGNSPLADYVWSFTTGPDPAPTVTSTDPLNLATNVAFNKKVSFSFSKVMDSLSAVSNFTLINTSLGGTAVAGSIVYTGTTAVFAPTVSLLPSTTYTATITNGAKDPSGIRLLNNYIWSFTTGALPAIISPTVTATDPSNSATGVAFNKKISVTFSSAMDATTITTTTFKLANTSTGGTAVSGVVSYAGAIAVFTPSVNLLPNTTYAGTVTTGAKDLAGNPLLNNYVWNFTTGAVPDIISPMVISTDPANFATNVALNKTVSANFNKVMDATTITTATFTLSNTTLGGTPVVGTVSYSGTTAVFASIVNLLPNNTYTATITMGAKDLAGNSVTNNYIWNFTTGAIVDGVAPTVIATDPINLATNVVLDKKVTATFSKAMNPATINTTSFTLKQGANSNIGLVTYTGVTATFSPSINLLPNTTYTATITTGAKDVAGNALVSNYIWQFTTAPQVLPPPSLGSMAVFGAFGGNAGVTNQGVFTVINGSIGSTAAATLITGFHDGTTGDVYTETPLNKGLVTDRIYTAPPTPGNATSAAIATQALADAIVTYNSISPASKPGGIDPGAGELGGLTLQPGIYKAAGGTFNITNGPLVLDAKGDANAVWIFQTAAGLTVGTAGPAGAKSVLLINGGQAKNVFWYVGSSATINGAGGGVMTGSIIANSGVSFSTAGNVVLTVLNGRAISLIASVTMVNTIVNIP